ncbi:metal-dependent hydrolase [Undibacterium sp.]|uniref:metal-dependent hydrolase n=1 Tax=Undibacterium sp. TaxID=1914977 RepID=UPI002B9E8700|nr:metal-dependent hydrolase [Undibacterium sp.]HTD05451.1 metal-dependent hydrolase [Undibacterium sp.]
MSAISIRRLNIDLSQGFPQHWLGGDAFRSQLFNALSMSFPLGEQFFIDSVRAAQPRISDPQLLEEIRGFIGQEATHRHLHAQFNEQLFKQGLKYVMEPWVKRRLRASKRLSVRSNLAVTMAYEHFTAIFADVVLRGNLEQAAEPARTLWEWHAVEETEHKSVAFDVYEAIGGGYKLRVGWYVYVWLMFLIDVIGQTGNNLYRDGHLFKPATWFSALGYLFGRKGLMWDLIPQGLSYLRPGFTPWQQDNSALAGDWLQRRSAAYRVVQGGNETVAAQTSPP